MNTPEQTAKALVDLAVHHAAVTYHNPALAQVSGTATAASRDDHYLVGAALIHLIRDTYDEAQIRIGEAGALRATWHHTTSNGHTYRCSLTLEAPR